MQNLQRILHLSRRVKSLHSFQALHLCSVHKLLQTQREVSPSVDRLNNCIIIATELGFCMMTWIINHRVGVPQTSALTDISDFGFDDSACLTSSNYCLSLGRHVKTEYEQKVKPATSHSYFVTSPPPSPSGNNMRFCFLVGFRFCSQTLQIFFCVKL